MEADQTLFLNLYLCLGERGQDELHNRKPHVDLAATRYPRELDEFESVFKKERNEETSKPTNYYPESSGMGRH